MSLPPSVGCRRCGESIPSDGSTLCSGCYWEGVREDCAKVWRQVEEDDEDPDSLETELKEAERKLAYFPKCVDCGAYLLPQALGSPTLRCPICRKVWRRHYQHEQYVKRKIERCNTYRRDMMW